MDLPPPVPVTAECVYQASQAYNVHPDILFAILMVEQGSVGEHSTNRDGSHDIGPAQINSVHLPELEAMGVTRAELQGDGCLNIFVQSRYVQIAASSWGNKVRSIDDYLYAISRYHHKDPNVASAYMVKLKAAFDLMYADDKADKK